VLPCAYADERAADCAELVQGSLPFSRIGPSCVLTNEWPPDGMGQLSLTGGARALRHIRLTESALHQLIMLASHAIAAVESLREAQERSSLERAGSDRGRISQQWVCLPPPEQGDGDQPRHSFLHRDLRPLSASQSVASLSQMPPGTTALGIRQSARDSTVLHHAIGAVGEHCGISATGWVRG
jgi:hypothetical protein